MSTCLFHDHLERVFVFIFPKRLKSGSLVTEVGVGRGDGIEK